LPAQRLGAVLPNAARLLLQKKYLRPLVPADEVKIPDLGRVIEMPCHEGCTDG
jgi:hypothetical protein